MTEADTKPKQVFWQFHLSTAVALVLVAGVITGVNLMDRMPTMEDPRDSELNALISIGIHKQYGWPMIAESIYYPGFLDFSHATKPEEIPTSKWNPTAVFIDLLMAVCILLAVAIICETLVRRGERDEP